MEILAQLYSHTFSLWFLKNAGGLLGVLGFFILGLVAITIFILFHLRDYKKYITYPFLTVSFILIASSSFIYFQLLKILLINHL